MINYFVGYSPYPDEGVNLDSFLEKKIDERIKLIGKCRIKASCEKDAYEIFINSPAYGDVLPRTIWVAKWGFKQRIPGFAREIYFNEHLDDAKKLYEEKFPKIAPCPDCGRELSRSATACPQCGYITPAGGDNLSGEEKYARMMAQVNAHNKSHGMPLIVQFAALGFVIIFVLPVLFKSCAP
jgi:ssDNA-binding Zn-finger/Zn-ribbon topoisomerase 1